MLSLTHSSSNLCTTYESNSIQNNKVVRSQSISIPREKYVAVSQLPGVINTHIPIKTVWSSIIGYIQISIPTIVINTE